MRPCILILRLLYFSLFLAGLKTYAQNKYTDSVRLVFNKASSVNAKCEQALILFRDYLDTQPDSAVKYLRYVKKNSGRISNKKLKARYYYYSAYYYDNNYIFDTTYIYCDSCISISASPDMDLQRADCYFSKALTLWYTGEYEKAAHYLKLTIPVFKKHKRKSKLLNVYNNLVAIYQSRNDERQVNYFFSQALAIADSTSNLSSLYINMAAFNDKSHNYKKTLEYYFKALEHTQKVGIKNPIIYSYIGGVYMNTNNYSKAAEYVKKGYNLALSSTDAEDILETTAVYALYFQNQGKFAQSLEILEQAKKYCDEENLPQPTSILYRNLTWALTELGRYKEALMYADKCLRFRVKSNDDNGTAEALEYKGHIFFKQKQYEQALKLYLEGLKLSERVRNKIFIKNFYQSLSRIYDEKGDYKNAAKFYRLYIEANDSISNANSARINSEMEEKYESVKKENEILTLNKESRLKGEELKYKALELHQSNQQRTFLIIGLCMMLVLLGFVVYSFVQKQKANKIISAQKKEVEGKNHLIEEKQKEIVDSITYAKRLQEAILPPAELVNECIPENFILYKPKDIVAGDFYWMEYITTESSEKIIIAAADSTGHGVPGAMVSVVCSNALNRAVKEFNLSVTGQILDKTRELVLDTFSKSTKDVKDGMDISLLCIDKKNKIITWSGANNPLWFINACVENDGLKTVKEIKANLSAETLSNKNIQHQLIEVKADKQPIGKTENPLPFTTHEIEMKAGDVFYLFTDGYADQFGGEKGKKFKYKQLEELLLDISNKEMGFQKEILDNRFESWKGSLEQVDDVCIIGIRL